MQEFINRFWLIVDLFTNMDKQKRLDNRISVVFSENTCDYEAVKSVD